MWRTPIAKKPAKIVASDVKQLSGGISMWGALISHGRDYGLQGSHEATVYAGSSRLLLAFPLPKGGTMLWYRFTYRLAYSDTGHKLQ